MSSENQPKVIPTNMASSCTRSSNSFLNQLKIIPQTLKWKTKSQDRKKPESADTQDTDEPEHRPTYNENPEFLTDEDIKMDQLCEDFRKIVEPLYRNYLESQGMDSYGDKYKRYLCKVIPCYYDRQGGCAFIAKFRDGRSWLITCLQRAEDGDGSHEEGVPDKSVEQAPVNESNGSDTFVDSAQETDIPSEVGKDSAEAENGNGTQQDEASNQTKAKPTEPYEITNHSSTSEWS